MTPFARFICLIGAEPSYDRSRKRYRSARPWLAVLLAIPLSATVAVLSGVRSDVAIEIFGDDLEAMRKKADEVAKVLATVPGAADVKVEQTTGLPMLTIDLDRGAIGRYGLCAREVQQMVSAAIGGARAGEVFEGDKRFDLIVRPPEEMRRDVRSLESLPLLIPQHDKAPRTAAEAFVPLGAIARIEITEGPNQVSREDRREAGAPIEEAVLEGSVARLRPVMMTALVAALGFVPMALTTDMGAEVQRPLATVVIGGILSSSVLTLIVLPVLYGAVHRQSIPARETP